MKITKAHADFWASKKAPVLFREVIKQHPPSIHDLIPHERINCDLHNTLQLLKSYRRKHSGFVFRLTGTPDGPARGPENIREQLAYLAARGGCINPQKRQAYVKRWLKRIEKNDASKKYGEADSAPLSLKGRTAGLAHSKRGGEALCQAL